jgi:hypothetical protein
MEGRSISLLWTRDLSSIPLERSVLPGTFTFTGVDSFKYDLASRTGGKVVTHVPTHHVSIYCNMPGGYITVATAIGAEVRWSRWGVLRAFPVDNLQGAIFILPEYTYEYLLVHYSREIASRCPSQVWNPNGSVWLVGRFLVCMLLSLLYHCPDG